MIKIYHNFQEFGDEEVDANLHKVFQQMKILLQEALKDDDEKINKQGGFLVINFNEDEFMSEVLVKGVTQELTEELNEKIDIILEA